MSKPLCKEETKYRGGWAPRSRGKADTKKQVHKAHRRFYKKFLRLVLVVGCITLFTFTTKAQTVCEVPAGFVCITQTAADKIAHDLDELKAARDTIAAFKNERLMTDAERSAYKTLTDALNAAFDARGKVVADQAQIIGIQAKALDLYATLVEKLAAQINKPKSAWAKFVGALEKVVVLLAGVAIGGAL